MNVSQAARYYEDTMKETQHVVVHQPLYVTLVRLAIAIILVGGSFYMCAYKPATEKPAPTQTR